MFQPLVSTLFHSLQMPSSLDAIAYFLSLFFSIFSEHVYVVCICSLSKFFAHQLDSRTFSLLPFLLDLFFLCIATVGSVVFSSNSLNVHSRTHAIHSSKEAASSLTRYHSQMKR